MLLEGEIMIHPEQGFDFQHSMEQYWDYVSQWKYKPELMLIYYQQKLYISNSTIHPFRNPDYKGWGCSLVGKVTTYSTGITYGHHFKTWLLHLWSSSLLIQLGQQLGPLHSCRRPGASSWFWTSLAGTVEVLWGQTSGQKLCVLSIPPYNSVFKKIKEKIREILMVKYGRTLVKPAEE